MMVDTVGIMKNREVAACLIRIADTLEIKGESGFKVIAYRRAARVLEDLTANVADLAAEGRLREIDGIGGGIARKIEEYLATGTMRKLLEAGVGVPEGLIELLRIRNLDARTIHIAYRELGVRNLTDLKRACGDGRLAGLRGLGFRKAAVIQRGIELYEKTESRSLN